MSDAGRPPAPEAAAPSPAGPAADSPASTAAIAASAQATAPSAAHTHTAPTRLLRRVGHWCLHGVDLGAQGLARLLLTGLLLLVLAALSLAALPLTEPGTRWLIEHVLDHLPGLDLTVQEPHGALLGDFSARELRLRRGQRTIVLHGLAWRGVDLRAPEADTPVWTLHVEQLHAARLSVSGPGSADPMALPRELVLPLQVRLAHVSLDRLELDALPDRPVERLALGLRLGAGRAAQHRLDELQLQWDRLELRGSAQLGAAEPLALTAELSLRPRPLDAAQGGSAGSATPAAPPGAPMRQAPSSQAPQGKMGAAAVAAASAPRPVWADDWRAELQASGPLAGFALHASLRARGQSLDAQAQVHIADALPVSRLRASMVGLDLAALASGLPRTALNGAIVADIDSPAPSGSASGLAPGSASDKVAGNGVAADGGLPLRLSADLGNSRPARLDQGGVPVRHLRLQAASHALDPSHGTVDALVVEFAGNTVAAPGRSGQAAAEPAAQAAARSGGPSVAPPSTSAAAATPGIPPQRVLPAGRLDGSGNWAWQGGVTRHLVLQTEASVNELQPALLDPRAPAIIVSGPFSLGYEQSLAPASTGSAAARSGASSPRLTLSTDLSGRLSQRPAAAARLTTRRPAGPSAASTAAPPSGPDGGAETIDSGLPAVRLQLKAGLSLDDVTLEQIEAQSGQARLRGSGSAQRRPGGWHIDLHNTLDDFDPSLWWPGAADSPWQRGPHRLAGELQALLDLPDARPGADTLLARLAGLSGSTRLALRSSVLAGVPLSGTLLLRSAGVGAGLGANPPSSSGASAESAAGLAGALGMTRVMVQAEVSVGDRAAPDDALGSGGLGLSLQGQLDPLGSDDNWQLDWQGRELDALTPWFRLAGSAWALHGDTRGSLAVQGRWPAMRSQGEIHAQRLLLISRPTVVVDSTAPTRSLTLSLEELDTRWQAGSRLDEPAELDLALASLRGAGLDLRDLQFGSRGTGQAHQLTLRSRWYMPVPAATPASASTSRSTSTSNGASTSTGVALAGRASASQAGVSGRSAATPAASAAGPTAATASNVEADSAASVVPRIWQLVLQAHGGVSASSAAGPTTATAVGPATRYLWTGQIDRLMAHDAATDAQALLRADGGADPASAAFAITPWLLRLAPASLVLGLGAGETSVQIGPTRLQMGDAQLALDALRWRQRPASGGATVDPATGAPIVADPLAAETDFDLSARLQSYAVAPLLVRLQPGFGWRGNLQLGGRIELHGHPDGLNADLELARSSGDLEVLDTDLATTAQRLGLRELRLGLQARNGTWHLSHRVDGSNLGRLDGEVDVTTRGPASWPARDDRLSGRIDLNVAQLGNWGRWLPAGWRLNGRLETAARLGGRLGAPEFSGELLGQQISVRNSLQGVNWTDARLRVALNGATARIDEFVVKGGNGTLGATGQLRLSGAPRLDVALTADHFAAMQRIDRRVVVSGTADLAVDANATRLSGRLRADEGRIDVSQGDAPTLGDDVSVVRPQADAAAAVAQERGGSPAAAAAPRARRGLQLDLRADLGDNFELRGRGITTQLGGVLTLSSPNDRFAINGIIRAVDGSYAAYGQKLSIDRGLLTFTGAAENPRLDIQATRPDLDDVKVGVAITGSAQSPRVRLFSEPEMSNTDKLSWLLLGRASDGLGSTDLSLLQRAAFSLLAGESDSPSLVQRLGLDQIGVRQTEGTVRETIVSLGKQLSRRWYVGYERSLNAATGSWQLIYRLAQRFTLRAQSGIDNAVDLIWTWKWGPDVADPAPPSTGP
ncbi:MAG: hypothetical protein RIQ60_3574 [Pseudomonadota bacterium]|jgi:translocation and assembly module TamB